MSNEIDSKKFSSSFSQENIKPVLRTLSPCLRLKVKISTRRRTYMILRNVGKASIKIGSGDEYYLGQLSASNLEPLSKRGTSTMCYDLRISEKEIDKIEDRRAEGDDLVLSLKLEFLLKRERSDQEGTVRFTDIQAEIPRSKWFDFLEQVGYREYTIIAIPSIRTIPSHENLQNAKKHLKEARRSYRNRDPVHNDCRKAVEAVDIIIQDISEDISGDKGKRIRKLISKMKYLFSIGSHSQEESWTGTIFGRDEEFALGITAQLVNYTAKTLIELSKK